MAAPPNDHRGELDRVGRITFHSMVLCWIAKSSKSRGFANQRQQGLTLYEIGKSHRKITLGFGNTAVTFDASVQESVT